MSKRFTLHGLWLSGPTYKVGLMLALSGEAFAYQHINLRAGEHKHPAYMAKNRYGQVPTLEDATTGLSLCQSAAILDYLAETLGKFGGKDAGERAQIREWMYWDFDRLAPPIYRMRAQRAGFRSFTQSQAEGLFADGNAALKVLDDHLAGRDWLVGKSTTIADIDVYGVATYAPQGGYSLAAYPNVAAWLKRVEALPGFAPQDKLLPMASAA
ncbi:MAG: glutathione S-transferase family protein [Alphaproteobacteria bacterium]